MKKWHNLSKEEIFDVLKTNKKGLSNDEVEKRIKDNGLNIIPKTKKKSFFAVFVNQLKSPIIYILFVAAILSFLLKESIDGIFIMLVIFLDAILGAIQEWRSVKNAEALEKLIKIEATVIRNEKIQKMDSEHITVGDIVMLESGSKVPADLRLIEAHNLSIDESLLTGESMGVNKNSKIINESIKLSDRTNMAYLGTSVLRGRGIGVVTSIGINTEIGTIAKEVLYAKDTMSPLETRMTKFTNQIGMIVALIAVVLTFILYFKGFVIKEIFFSVVALSVSAIPEGLPVALTLALSIASNRMAKKNVLVKKLNAVESLGSSTVIASDKTGTLTINEQTAKVIVLPDNKKFDIKGIGYNDEGRVVYKTIDEKKVLKELVKSSILSNEAILEKDSNNMWISRGDSIDTAFLSLGLKLGMSKSDYEDNIIGIIPYESDAKYSAAFYEENDEKYCFAKGSLEKIIELSNKMLINNRKVKLDIQQLSHQNEILASQGYRVIAVASGKCSYLKSSESYNENDIPELTILGLVGFIDPIRKEAVNAIKKCNDAGIKTVMITGDHPLTAYYIAKELNIVKSQLEIATGEEIDKIYIEGDEAFDKFVKDKRVFSRVNPMQKLMIVNSYKRQGEFIAVTGDGVNDAPALKAANVGIAMGSGTDVAKETSSMIITDDNFASIVSGIEEGRCAYNNVRKVIYLLLSCAVCEIIFFALSIVFNYEIPLLAIHLLWLNLVTDGIQDAALAFEKGEKDVMKKSPRSPKENIFDKLLTSEILLSGIVMGLMVFFLWIYLIDVKGVDIIYARSSVILLMVFLQNLHVLNCRSERQSIFKTPLKNNYFVCGAIIFILFLQFVIVENSFLSSVLDTVPISILQVFEIFLFAIPIIIMSEIQKIVIRKNEIGGMK